MNIVVLLKQTVDLVEELELNDDGTDIEREYLSFKLNEWDEQALEEALLLKDAGAGSVTVIALDETDVDQSLYSALAKGADRAVKLTGDFEGGVSSHRRAAILAEHLQREPYDLVLIGVQTPEDLDGQAGVILAGRLGVPHVSVAIGVEPLDGGVKVSQEFGAGVVHELKVAGPAVIGVQAARQAPRYVPISRIRAAMQEGGIEEAPAPEVPAETGLKVRRMYAPESSSHAEMLSGGADAVAARIVEIIRERGILK
ncbi:MAG TPA: electron transfer flavoprotein subunit beta/FixA family protein [Solirubrobacteraceae bacterium]|nr:electron transfer flavoprotein subunit beta/FixA family protein [Solirubrobacteraceae bacterium]